MSLFIFIKKEVITMSFEDTTGNCAVTVKSPPGTRDEYEIAELIITGGINNKEYTYTVWRGDSTLEAPLDFGATYVFLPDLQSLDMNDNLLNLSKEELKDVLENELLGDYALGDIITVDHAIEEALKSDNDFSIKIDHSNIHHAFVNGLIVEREIIEMIYKAHSGELTKQDLLDFGGLLIREDNYLEFNKNAFSYLQKPAENVLKKEGVTRIERKYINKAFEALQLDTSSLPKEKQNKKELELER